MPTVPVGDVGSSELCYFCSQQLYVLERGSAEGKFFHRSCFTCQQCGTTLRQGGYTFYADTGQLFHCLGFITSATLNITQVLHVVLCALQMDVNEYIFGLFGTCEPIPVE